MLTSAAPGLDAAASAAGLSAADIGGSVRFAGRAAGIRRFSAGLPERSACAPGIGGASSATPAAGAPTSGSRRLLRARRASARHPALHPASGRQEARPPAPPRRRARRSTPLRPASRLGRFDGEGAAGNGAPAAPATGALGTSGAPAGLTTGATPAAGADPLFLRYTAAASPGIGSSILSGVKSYGPLALGAAGLLSSLSEADKKPAYQSQVNQQADQLSAQGQQLPILSPERHTAAPAFRLAFSRRTIPAAATIRSQYTRARGQSGSSAEAQDLANLSATTVSQGAQVATNLLQQGVSESEFSAQLYSQLMSFFNSAERRAVEFDFKLRGFAGRIWDQEPADSA